MEAPRMSLLGAFLRDVRGSAGVELAIGAVCVVAAAAICFDLYSLVKVDKAGARSAVAMAEYVAGDPAPNGDQMAALGEFLHREEFDAPVAMVYAVSAVRRPLGGDPAAILWVEDSIRIGDTGATDSLAAGCAERATKSWQPTLLGPPDDSGIAEGQVMIVAEVCAAPQREGALSSVVFAGELYRLHVLPARENDQAPQKPVRTASAEP